MSDRGGRPLRFSPSGWQLLGLDALAGAVAMFAVMQLRFVDEGGVPPTYATRILPWVVLGALLQVAAGEVMNRLRKPGSHFAQRPVLPFLAVGLGTLLVVLATDDLILREPWRLPHTVAVIAPLLAAAASATLRLAAARTLDVDELLTRPIVHLDVDACAPTLAGKRVLITGAAGSIGSELARQVLAVAPAMVIAIDVNETGLFELHNDVARLGHAVEVRTCIADVADDRRIRELFLRERPDVVFHAAAYKHVPLVEANPEGGFVTNVLGTLSVCEAAVAAGAERVVVISTDKAVNPTSFMGLTKRVAELMAVAVGAASGEAGTGLSAVRFGNVLGSRGSVVPTLLRQIESGGPVTITDPDAKRFFMTISEAASLVLLSAAFGGSGGLFVLDMGDEVRIQELAERLVRLKGLRPGRDISFSYTGLRPGEKLHEELHGSDERLVATERPAVWHVETAFRVDAPTLLDGVREINARRLRGEVDSAEYPELLRSLIARATREPVGV